MSTPPSEHPLFREIADIAPVMIWIAGLDKQCTYFNRVWLDFTGRRLEEELGTGWANGVHPDDFRRCLDVYREAFDARRPFTLEYRLRRHDGAYRWILDNGKPIHSDDSEFLGYAGSCVDITEQKGARLELERSEERYKLVMDIISEGVWDINIKTNEQYVSPSYLASLGYSRADLGPDIITDLIGLIHSEDREQALAAINNGLESGAFDVEFRHLTKAGEYRWMRSRGRVLLRDEDGAPVRVIGTHSDIDSQKRAEIALQESEHILKNERDELEWIYTNAPIGLCMFDRDMRYRRINQRLADIVNLPIDAHIGKRIDEIIPDLARRVRNAAQKVLLTGLPSVHNEVTGPTPDARDDVRTFLFSCYPVFDADRIVSGFGYVVQDITEQKNLETRLQRLNAELEGKIAERTKELAEANAALKELSRTDALTSLPNRLAANERFRSEHSRLKRTREPYAVLMADIDYFKRVNDEHGHIVGDEMLRAISDVFARNIRTHDFVARYGGEEFVFLLPSTHLDQALVVAEKLRKAVAEIVHPVAGAMTVSIGVAEASPDQDSDDQAIQEADSQLYRAKTHGRNRVASKRKVEG